ncbi:MAG: TlpA family protein disulfide reductase [Actinomycetota bacterium]
MSALPTAFYVSYVLLWALMLFLGVLLLLVYRHFGVIAMGTYEGVQRDGLAIGEKAPDFSGVTARGQEITLSSPGGQSRFLLFAHPDCGPCEAVMPFVNHLGAAAQNGLDLEVAAVVSGPRDEVERLVERYDPPFLALAEDGSGVFNLYRVRVTPFAFVIGGDGRVVAKGLCNDPVRVRDMLTAGGLDKAAAELDAAIVAAPATAEGEPR